MLSTAEILHQEVKPFYQFRHQLNVENDLLLGGARVVVPVACQAHILRLLHEGHFGISKNLAKANDTVWWPGISRDMEQTVRTCRKCVETTTNRKMPLEPTPFPERPWQRVAMGLFYQSKKWWLIIVDYYSRYPEIALLNKLTAVEVINNCKSVFARHGIPEVVVSDNGPQFPRVRESNFADFARDYGFQHITSSPHYPQSNGMAEAAVKIIKTSMSKTQDPYITLLAYRTTPLKNACSPSQLLMGRRLRANLSEATRALLPATPGTLTVRKFDIENRENQHEYYNSRHGVRDLVDLLNGEEVWVSDMQKKGKVVDTASEPRSYIVDTGDSVVRRNRTHLVPSPQMQEFTPPAEQAQEEAGAVTHCQDTSHGHTRSGRCTIPPKKYIASVILKGEPT